MSHFGEKALFLLKRVNLCQSVSQDYLRQSLTNSQNKHKPSFTELEVETIITELLRKGYLTGMLDAVRVPEFRGPVLELLREVEDARFLPEYSDLVRLWGDALRRRITTQDSSKHHSKHRRKASNV